MRSRSILTAFLAITTTIPATAQTQTVTFTEHIAPILFNHCASCHRPGQAAPFSLLSYEDAAKRAKQIATVTSRRYMPPWKPEPGPYPLRDVRRLSDEQIALFQEWVKQDLPEGDPGALPAVPDFPIGWQLGTPDMIVEMPEAYKIRADGPDIYRNFTIPIALPEDKWIRAIELRPTARQAVHHVLYFSDNTKIGRALDAADPQPGYSDMTLVVRSPQLGGWTVGQQPAFYQDGMALPLPRGSDLILQYHFSPTGKPEEEKTQLGLYFADKAPERTLVDLQLPVLFGYFSRIDIPAGTKDFRVSDEFVLPVDVEAVSVRGHAHYRGKDLRLTAELPDGTVNDLLAIPDWDFAWQDQYFYEQLVPLPKGTKIKGTVVWDNSADNPRNPANPPIRVKWGEKSTDEMGSLFLQVVPTRQEDLRVLQAAYDWHLFMAAIKGR